MVGNLKHPPGVLQLRIVPAGNLRFHFVKSPDRIILHSISQPGGQASVLVGPGDEVRGVQRRDGFEAGGRLRRRLKAEVGVLQDFSREGLEKFKNARFPRVVFAESLIVHVQADDRFRRIDTVKPAGEFRCRQGVFGPFAVIEAESDVVGEAVIPQQELQPAASRRPVRRVAAPSRQEPVGALCQDRSEIHLFSRAGQVVVVDKFGVAEGPGRLAEKRLNSLFVGIHLAPEFLPGEQKGEGMAVGFAQELDGPRTGQLLKAVQNVRPVVSQLIQKRAADRKGDAEPAGVPPDQSGQDPVCRQVAAVSHAVEDLQVRLPVFVVMHAVHVEDGVSPQAAGLVNLETQADDGHVQVSFRFRQVS